MNAPEHILFILTKYTFTIFFQHFDLVQKENRIYSFATIPVTFWTRSEFPAAMVVSISLKP